MIDTCSTSTRTTSSGSPAPDGERPGPGRGPYAGPPAARPVAQTTASSHRRRARLVRLRVRRRGNRGVRDGRRAGAAQTRRSMVLPHEDVIPEIVTDRLAMMAAAQANLEPILLVYDGAGSTPEVHRPQERDPLTPIVTCGRTGRTTGSGRSTIPRTSGRSGALSPRTRPSLPTVTTATRPIFSCDAAPLDRRGQRPLGPRPGDAHRPVAVSAAARRDPPQRLGTAAGRHLPAPGFAITDAVPQHRGPPPPAAPGDIRRRPTAGTTSIIPQTTARPSRQRRRTAARLGCSRRGVVSEDRVGYHHTVTRPCATPTRTAARRAPAPVLGRRGDGRRPGRQDHAPQIDLVRPQTSDGARHAQLRRRALARSRREPSAVAGPTRRVRRISTSTRLTGPLVPRKNLRRIAPATSTYSPGPGRIERWTSRARPRSRWCRRAGSERPRLAASRSTMMRAIISESPLGSVALFELVRPPGRRASPR